jgi:hypothetical protein
MKVITTKYLGATNTLPSRIKASAEGVPARVWTVNGLENELIRTGQQGLHEIAARKFAEQQGWNPTLASGGTAKPDVWVHCFIPEVVPATLKMAEAFFDVFSVSSRFDGLRDSVARSIKALNL